MSDAAFGGRITLEFAGQVITIASASVKIDVAGQKSEAMANQDGSVCYRYTPAPRVAEFTARDDSAIDWPTFMRAAGNATIVEVDNGITHLFTGCRLTGQPMQDRDTGEVSGIKVEGGQYRKVLG